jgi:hypothetical protein
VYIAVDTTKEQRARTQTHTDAHQYRGIYKNMRVIGEFMPKILRLHYSEQQFPGYPDPRASNKTS